jgi:hypothetical protein
LIAALRLPSPTPSSAGEQLLRGSQTCNGVAVAQMLLPRLSCNGGAGTKGRLVVAATGEQWRRRCGGQRRWGSSGVGGPATRGAATAGKQLQRGSRCSPAAAAPSPELQRGSRDKGAAGGRFNGGAATAAAPFSSFSPPSFFPLSHLPPLPSTSRTHFRNRTNHNPCNP